MNTSCRKLKSQITQSLVLLFTVMAIVGTVFCADVFAGTGHDDQSVKSDMDPTKAGVMKYALIAASVAFGLGAIGAGIAISHVGAAAMGAVAEKPEVGSQALLFIALAEGLVVFGFITSILILNKV